MKTDVAPRCRRKTDIYILNPRLITTFNSTLVSTGMFLPNKGFGKNSDMNNATAQKRELHKKSISKSVIKVAATAPPIQPSELYELNFPMSVPDSKAYATKAAVVTPRDRPTKALEAARVMRFSARSWLAKAAVHIRRPKRTK